ncbi:DUF4179 domain-containing protein [Lottiidibacillus patelloidae]|nr:DUF4179 domain-containing protein [Lottiidibacillus patelloidae]
MYNHEDEKLKEIKRENDNIKIPDDIDSYIRMGIDNAKKKKKISSNLRIATLAASILLATLITSASLSPAFANYLKTVPGISAFFELLGGADKGIREAVTNDYIQEIGVSNTVDDQTFTVDHIIFDRSRMIIFYTFDFGQDYIPNENYFLRPKILNENGEGLSAGISWGGMSGEKNIKKGRIEVSKYNSDLFPDTLTIQVQIEKYFEESKEYGLVNDRTFSVSFFPNKEKYFSMEEEVLLNEKVSIEGFTFNVDRAVIYPTQIAVFFSGLDQNSLELLSFHDFRLVDETGEEWNFISGHGSGEKTYTMYFESNFFKNRNTLSLEGSTISALPKEDLLVAIDVKEMKLLKQPDDRISFDGIEPSYFEEDQMSLEFSLTLNEDDPNPSYFSFVGHLMEEDGSMMLDEEGNHVDYVGSQGSRYDERIDGNHIAYASIDIDKSVLDKEEVIYLKLSNYPNYFTQPFSIKIK